MGIFSEIAVEQQLWQMRAFKFSLPPTRCSGFLWILLGQIQSLVVVCGKVHLLITIRLNTDDWLTDWLTDWHILSKLLTFWVKQNFAWTKTDQIKVYFAACSGLPQWHPWQEGSNRLTWLGFIQSNVSNFQIKKPLYIFFKVKTKSAFSHSCPLV